MNKFILNQKEIEKNRATYLKILVYIEERTGWIVKITNISKNLKITGSCVVIHDHQFTEGIRQLED